MLFNNFSLELLPFLIIALVVGFTIHEYAHAALAYKFGDPTAKNQGRLTLNPMAHIDPLGTILILLVGFGWARPVPVDSRNFKNPKLAGVIVSLAGPLSNFLVALLSVVIWYLFIGFGVDNGIDGRVHDFLFGLVNFMVKLNVLLFVFNLLPLPPLDGYRIIEELAPRHLRYKMRQFEGYAIFIFLLLVLTPLSNYTIDPLFYSVIPGIIQFLHDICYPILQLGGLY
jgi:Zn-dependent protease